MLLLSNVLVAQSKHFEGYDGLAWGSSIQELKDKYPEVIETTDAEDRKYNKRFFKTTSDEYYRLFFYYNEKLYIGRTIYENVDEAFIISLVTKVVEKYGFITDRGETEKSDRLHHWFEISLTKNFSVTVETYDFLDSFGRVFSNMIFITYANDVIKNIVREDEIEQKKKDIEL